MILFLPNWNIIQVLHYGHDPAVTIFTDNGDIGPSGPQGGLVSSHWLVWVRLVGGKATALRTDLLRFMHEIAEGMAYLDGSGVLHEISQGACGNWG